MSTPQDQLVHLISFQRRDVLDSGLYGKLTFEDLKRLDLITQGDVVFSKQCCLYKGKPKGSYCTFSFRGKKVSLLRLLYHNYYNDIKPSHRIKFLCENEGLCCNINHFFMITDEPLKDPEESEESESDTEKRAEEDNAFKIE